MSLKCTFLALITEPPTMAILPARASPGSAKIRQDAGPIGYQCAHCEGGVHHLFEEHVHLEVLAGEAVVTSLIKRDMPVIRLRTGDLVEAVKEPCP